MNRSIKITSLTILMTSSALHAMDPSYASSLATEGVVAPNLSEQAFLQSQESEKRSQDSLNREFLLAAAHGNLERARELLAQGADVNTSESNAMRVPARADNVPMVKFLLDMGLNVRGNRAGHAALYEATQRGHYDIVKLLLNAGAELSFPSQRERDSWLAGQHVGMTLKSNFSSQEGQALLEQLRAAGLKTDLLREAIKRHNAAQVKTFLAQDIQINSPDSYENTPLILAAEGFSQEIIEMLIKAGADAHARGWKGETALHKALARFSRSRDFDPDTSQMMVWTILETIPLSEKEQIEKARASVPAAIHSVRCGIPKPPRDICKILAKEIQLSTIHELINNHMHYALTLLAQAQSIATEKGEQSILELIGEIESPEHWQLLRKNVESNIRLILSGEGE